MKATFSTVRPRQPAAPSAPEAGSEPAAEDEQPDESDGKRRRSRTGAKAEGDEDHAGHDHSGGGGERASEEQLRRTFETNIFSYFFMTQAALPHLKKGASVINTGSVTGTRGHKTLLDYSATKGAIQSFTFSLAQNLADKGIRVNAVAPGPIWTPLIPASFDEDQVAKFGADTPLGRAGQPNEVASAFLFLATEGQPPLPAPDPWAAHVTGRIEAHRIRCRHRDMTQPGPLTAIGRLLDRHLQAGARPPRQE